MEPPADTGMYKSDIRHPCPVCKVPFDARALASHKKRCEQQKKSSGWGAAKRKRNAELQLQRSPKRSRRMQRQPSPSPSPAPQNYRAQTPLGEDVGTGSATVEVAPPPPIDLYIDPSRDPRGGAVGQVQSVHENEAPASSERQPLRPTPGEANASSSRHTHASQSPGDSQQADALPSTRQRLQHPVADDIRVMYHSDTQRPSIIYPFEKYREQEREVNPDSLDETPWRPFQSRVDFEFAELTHEAHMNRSQITRLLRLIGTITSHPSRFTFKTSEDVDKAWKVAEMRHPTFTKTIISASYKDKTQEMEFYCRPLWDWIVAQVQNPLLAPHFRWDAQRLFKYDADKSKWVRFYHEPWTANKFWDVQSEITAKHPGAKPLSIILWSDKAKLSSFGTQKGHPIVMRIGNLPAEIRNGAGNGGGQIVGFIPVLTEDSKESRKPAYIDFKNAIFHASFCKLLERLAPLSHHGCQVPCGDLISRLLFPFIHILVSDYEEQCYMALIRGLRGLFPCPVCLIPSGQLSDILGQFEARIASEVQEKVEKNEPKTHKEKVLLQISIRAVRNAFWDIANSDVHQAISFDRLHAYFLGLWSKHLWIELKTLILELGREAEVHLNEGMANVPRWPELTHFNTLLRLDFADGAKWNDVSKVILPVIFRALPKALTKKGYALLKLIRKYVELNTYLSLSVQTEDTLDAFELTLSDFEARLQDYRHECRNDEKPKDWDGIIKVHSHVHAIRDIRAKGIIANMDTKRDEKLQGPMRWHYKLQTNFRDVEKQLARLEDHSATASVIRAHIFAWDSYCATLSSSDLDDDEPAATLWQFGQVYLGARQPPRLLQHFIDGNDQAFTAFRFRLSTCITGIIKWLAERNELQGVWDGARVQVPENTMITECRYIRVDYESKASWRMLTDKLRCSPDFFGLPRYDTVLVNINEGQPLTFCKLVRIFTCKIAQDRGPYALALVQPYKIIRPTATDARIDRDLGLCRVQESARRDTVVVPARSIIRGAILIEDTLWHGHSLVVDTLDEDMFLRLIQMFPNRDMAAERL